ncbi:transposase [Candidatus Williamhamiltonella defendens]|nr:hypothetical protein [Candidatus Hamiltonella defensa]ATW29869.1 transposase [Candidatus Hamiltonella defensa]ATW30006.1 transposase [Candidatus Hamiltonella defensa]ATW30071.1 transposase [Candidatus Hamiltonella defensa]ATW30281.1 transposase [Candidatus Hamiltonella defensa]ATW31842.1 transposase [Candidatus Hamiltonella defensa]
MSAMVSERGIPPSRYRATRVMRQLERVSHQPPTHQYKKARQEHQAIPDV